MKNGREKITLRAFAFGLLFVALFAVLSVYVHHDFHPPVFVSATQIPVLPYVLLFLTVLLINPLCRLLRFSRAFSQVEILIVFIMGLVSAGISTSSLTGPIVGTVGSLFSTFWNNEQSEWNRFVVPFLEDGYFLGTEGIREAAAAYAESHTRRQRIRNIVDAAERYLSAVERQADAEEQWRRARTTHEDDPDAAAVLEQKTHQLQVSVRLLLEARESWKELRLDNPDLPSAEETLEHWRPRLKAAESRLREKREQLRELEEIAFEKADTFRRGLPRHMRAYPGFVKLPQDTLGSYLSRFQRMREGHRASGELAEALKLLEAGSDRTDELGSLLESLRTRFSLMGDTSVLVLDLDEKVESVNEHNEQIAILEDNLRRRHHLRREARRDEMRVLERRIHQDQRRLRSLARRRDKVVESRDHLQQQLDHLQLVGEIEQSLGTLSAAVAAGEPPADADDTLREIRDALPAIDGCLRRFMVGDVPWGQWGGILLRWMLLAGLTYVMFMTFNVLIFRQWAHNEKLIYPLAELPMFLAGHGSGTASGGVPGVFLNGLFWVGFAISGSVMGYNALVMSDLIPGLNPLDISNQWAPYLPDTPLRGLLHGRYSNFSIFFTMVGLSFLIPKKVSCSLWLFAVLAMVQVLIMVRLGYGVDESSFLSWHDSMNFRTAQGGGALLVFSSVVLFKCRRYLWCAFAPSLVRDLPAAERRELRISSLLFVLASIGLMMTLWLGMGANPLFTIALYLLVMLITIGLVRAVAEGGILALDCGSTPIQFLRTLFGVGGPWTSTALFAPLMVYYWIFFFDLRSFIAPAMANSLKIREELKMQRGRFHLSVIAAIVIAAAVSLPLTVIMNYASGADLMGWWFHQAFPYRLFRQLEVFTRWQHQPITDQTLWVVVGAAAMAALLYFRRTVFWMPHPIGMVMLMNPVMGAYWFSIMLGWAAKTLVIRYGNQDTYAKARNLFIGLIIGEMFVVTVSMIFTITTHVHIPIDLSR